MRKTIYSQESRALSKWLINQRKQAGLTQREFAKLLGIHHSIIGKIEKGERRIDVVEFVKYCEVLEADPHAALDEVKKSMRGKRHSLRP